MCKTFIIAVAGLVTLACFADEASARPWRNRYDYYYGSGSQPYVAAPRASGSYSPNTSPTTLVPPASGYYYPISSGYSLVPPASGYFGPYSSGYTLVPPGSFYYSPPTISLGSYDYPWSVPGPMGYSPY